MRRFPPLLQLSLAWVLCGPALHAQSPALQTLADSIRAETCRGGTLKGVRCTGRKLALRLTAVRRFANRLDSIATAAPRDTSPPVVVVPPKPDTAISPKDSTPSTPPTPGDTTTPPTVTPPTPSAGVELPRSVPTWPAALETASCTVTVAANLQAALNAARASDVLCLSGTFVGQFTLPARSDTGWVVVRSQASVTPPGQRVRPSLAGPLARLATNLGGGAPTLRAAPGARGWYLTELNVTIDPAVTAILSTIVDLPRGASHIVFDRVWLHAGVTQQVQRCLALNSAQTAVVHSWLDDCHAKGYDSQAIVSWASDGPVLLEDNTLAGAGENVMLGGADPSTPGVVPQDWTIRRNHILTPLSWKGVWTKKNLFETKNARRILVEANVLEGSWADGQIGYAFVLKTSNQSGSCTWCTFNDATIRQNLILRVAGVFGVTGKEGSNPNPLDSLGRRIAILDNYADSVGLAPYTGAQQLVALSNRLTDLTITGNTILGVSLSNDLMVQAPTPAIAATHLTFARNVLTRARNPLHGCGTVITVCLPGAVLTSNVFIGAAIAGAPPGIASAPSLAAARLLGAGIDRAVIDAAVRGVVVQP